MIAYKELHMNDRFEPEESPYRTAKILANDNGVLELRLSILDRRPGEIDFNEDTGERIYKKFDVPVDEEESDEKLIQTPRLQDVKMADTPENKMADTPANKSRSKKAE